MCKLLQATCTSNVRRKDRGLGPWDLCNEALKNITVNHPPPAPKADQTPLYTKDEAAHLSPTLWSLRALNPKPCKPRTPAQCSKHRNLHNRQGLRSTKMVARFRTSGLRCMLVWYIQNKNSFRIHIRSYSGDLGFRFRVYLNPKPQNYARL